MSTKQMHTLNYWWSMLESTTAREGGSVSAGQVAKEAGTARNTAKKWLEELVKNGAAVSDKIIGRNHSEKVVYYVIG